MSKPTHFLIIARPMRPVPMMRDRLAGNFVAKERQIRMPRAPLVVAHEVLGGPEPARQAAQDEEGELGGGFRQHIGRMGEWNFVTIGVGAIDVVEADRNLRNYLQRALAGFEDLGINRVAQGGDQAVDTAADFLDDQALRRSFRTGIESRLRSRARGGG